MKTNDDLVVLVSVLGAAFAILTCIYFAWQVMT